MTALIAVEAVVLVLLCLLMGGLLRSHAAILRRLHDLETGASPRPPADEGRPAD